MTCIECQHGTDADAPYYQIEQRFSKKLDNLKAACALHFAYYDFCRVHRTLRVTPAMEAGITDHVWSFAEPLRAV